MRNYIFLLLIFCSGIFLSNCNKNEDSQVNPSPASTTVGNKLKATTNTLSLRGINWADPNGNAPTGVVLPSGLTASSTASQAATVATRIALAVKASGGTTIRMPINYGTTSNSSYWAVYQSAINAVVSNGCKVILCYWCPTGGSITSMTEWNSIWASVDNVYKNNANVLYEPINEPFSYNATDLLNIYGGFMTTYSPAAGKCIFDGTGYAMDVTSIGGDSRISTQYLGLHAYWWFWGNYNVWSTYYNTMSSKVGSYASRTVVTEVGVETMRTYDFYWQWQTGAQNDAAFLTGSLSYAKDNSIGTIAWSGVNDIDTYRWYVANDNLVEVNPGCANMYRWSWGLAAQWLGPIPNGNYKLVNRASGKALDNMGVTTTGSNVCQYTSGTSNNQKWQVDYVNGYYVLYCTTGNLCLDAGTNTADGSNMLQYDHNSNTSQQWTIVSAGSGYYKLINRATGKCLDTGGLTANGSVMQQWYSNSSNNQQWTFTLQ